MKADNRTRVVLVPRDSRRPAPFKTVRFEDRKRAVATKYGIFWSMLSRKIT